MAWYLATRWGMNWVVPIEDAATEVEARFVAYARFRAHFVGFGNDQDDIAQRANWWLDPSTTVLPVRTSDVVGVMD